MHFHTPSGQAEITERIRLLECKAIFYSLDYMYSYHPINVQLILKIQERGRWQRDRWEWSPLPLNTSETPSWSEEQSEQSTVFQHIWRSKTKDRGHWKIWQWDNKTWRAEKTRERPCYTHKHQLKTSEHRRLRRHHHWIPLAFYHWRSYHNPRESEQTNLRSRG